MCSSGRRLGCRQKRLYHEPIAAQVQGQRTPCDKFRNVNRNGLVASVPGEAAGIFPVRRLDVWVSSVLEQQFARFEFSSICSKHQRGPAVLVKGIEGGSMLDQF